jgi:signal recognition particle receptor subunit beta
VVLWLVCGGRGSRGRYICLLGLSNSGKTLVFMRLVYGQFRETQVSIKENMANYTPKKKGKAVELVDVPGDERVRQTVFDKYKHSLRAVVVVIDSDNFPSEVRGVAELVYDLLQEPVVVKGKAPVLMTCNKQDLSLAKNKMAVRKLLEEEISELRVSRSAKLTSLGSKGQSQAKPLGKSGKPFEFSDLPKGVKIEFISCSARGRGQDGEAELDEVTSWLDQHC